jgi:hypothetical protein
MGEARRRRELAESTGVAPCATGIRNTSRQRGEGQPGTFGSMGKQRRARPSSRRARGEFLGQEAEDHCGHDSAGDPTEAELETLCKADKARRRTTGCGMTKAELKAELDGIRELEHRRRHKAARRAANARTRFTPLLMKEAKDRKSAAGRKSDETPEDGRKVARSARNRRRNATNKADDLARKASESLASRKPKPNRCRRRRLKAKHIVEGTWRRNP